MTTRPCTLSLLSLLLTAGLLAPGIAASPQQFEELLITEQLRTPPHRTGQCYFADVDGDGDPDLLTANLAAEDRVRINDGSGHFAEETGAAAQSALWIVGQSGCPRVNFTEIQPAVEAASEGDVILLRRGIYGDVTIDGKALTIASDGNSGGSIGSITVRNLRPEQAVLLHGFQNFRTGVDRLTLVNNLGPVWIQNFITMQRTAEPGLAVRDCRSVLVISCTVNSTGGTAARLSNSGVYFYDSRVFPLEVPASGRVGVAGMHVTGGSVLFSGCHVAGGEGRAGIPTGSGGIGSVGCAPGFPGGPGLEHTGGSVVYLADTLVEGGAGGPGRRLPGPGPRNCGRGPQGAAFVGLAGQRVDLQTGARRMLSVSPILEGQVFPTSFEGEAGELVAVHLGTRQGHLFHPGLAGVLAVQPAASHAVLGNLSSSGGLFLGLAMPNGLVTRGNALVLYNQGLFLDATGRLLAGAPFAWIVLDKEHDPRDGCP